MEKLKLDLVVDQTLWGHPHTYGYNDYYDKCTCNYRIIFPCGESGSDGGVGGDS